MKEIRRYPDFVLFVVYIVSVISSFLQGCITWWVRHSFCILISLYCQYFPNLKINYKKVLAFMSKFPVFTLMMYFMNRFCCRLWASRLTNIFPLMKNCMTFQHAKKWYKSENEISRNSQLMKLLFKKYLPRKFPGEH